MQAAQRWGLTCVVAGDAAAQPQRTAELIVETLTHTACAAPWCVAPLRPLGFTVSRPTVPDCRGVVVDVTIQVLASPPKILLTGVDVVVLVFSPAHPQTFRHLHHTWLRVLSHLRRVPHIILVSRMERLLQVTALASPRTLSRRRRPIDVADVLDFAAHETQTATLREAQVLLCSRHQGLRTVGCGERRQPLLVLAAARAFAMTCVSTIAGEAAAVTMQPLPRPADVAPRYWPSSEAPGAAAVWSVMGLADRWAAALDELQAMQQEKSLLSEWLVVPSPDTGRHFYASRVDGTVTVVRPWALQAAPDSPPTPWLPPRQGDAAQPSHRRRPEAHAYLKRLECEVEQRRAERNRIEGARTALAAQREVVRQLEDDVDRYRALLGTTSTEVEALTRRVEAAGAAYLALTSAVAHREQLERDVQGMPGEVTALKHAYLRQRGASDAKRRLVEALADECRVATDRVEELQSRIAVDYDPVLATLRGRYAAQYAALDAWESRLLELEQRRLLHGMRHRRPMAAPEPLTSGRAAAAERLRARRVEPQRRRLLRALAKCTGLTIPALLDLIAQHPAALERWPPPQPCHADTSDGESCPTVAALLAEEARARARHELESQWQFLEGVVLEGRLRRLVDVGIRLAQSAPR